jgi:hypothetical protein
VNSLDVSQLLLRAIESAGIASNGSTPTFRQDEQIALAVLTPAGDVSRNNHDFSFF